MTGYNLKHRVLKALANADSPMTAQQLVEELDSTEGSVAVTLSKLTRPRLVVRSNGYITITLRGREALKTDPLVKAMELPQIKDLLDWKAVSADQVCRVVIEKKDIFDPSFIDIFRPVVLAYMVACNLPIPNLTFEERDPTVGEEKAMKCIKAFLDTIVKESETV